MQLLATSFFRVINCPNEVQFIRNAKGLVSGFTVLGEDKEEAKKLPAGKAK